MLSTHYIDVFLLMSAEYFFARLTTNAYTNSEYVWFIHLYVVNYPSSFLLCWRSSTFFYSCCSFMENVYYVWPICPLVLLWCHYIATQSPIGGGVFGSGGGEYQSLCNSLLELDWSRSVSTDTPVFLSLTSVNPFSCPLSRTTRVSQYQKGKTNLVFTEARDSEWQWHQLGHMQVCTSLHTDNHASTPLLSFFTGRMPFLPPNQQRQSTEGILNRYWYQYASWVDMTQCDWKIRCVWRRCIWWHQRRSGCSGGRCRWSVVGSQTH